MDYSFHSWEGTSNYPLQQFNWTQRVITIGPKPHLARGLFLFSLLRHKTDNKKIKKSALICSEWAALTHVHGSNESFEIMCFVPVPSFVVVCVFTCTRMCNSPFSLQYFSTQWQPIQIQLKRHRGLRSIIHSTVIHSLPPPSSPSAACGWLGGNRVGELYHFLVLSLCLLPFIPPIVSWHLGVNMFHLAWCQNVYFRRAHV